MEAMAELNDSSGLSALAGSRGHEIWDLSGDVLRFNIEIIQQGHYGHYGSQKMI
jgi:hypothetical protein